MKKSKYAFTVIELIFVIVILGILSAIAIPKLSSTKELAEITKARSDISSIRSAIITERQSRLITGDSSWISVLSQNTTTLFDGNGTSNLLMYGMTASTGSGHWQSTSGTAYTYTVGSTVLAFTYDNATGIFTCSTTAGTDAQDQLCKDLIH